MRLRLYGFRAFDDSGWMDFRPLTCLVGRNSSGKSSVIAALLMLKQSIEDLPFAPIPDTRLVLSGNLIDLGIFDDVIHRHNSAATIGIDIEASAGELRELDKARRSKGIVPQTASRKTARHFFSYHRFQSREAASIPADSIISISLRFRKDEPFGPTLNQYTVSINNVGLVEFTRSSGDKKTTWKARTENLPPRSLELRSFSHDFFPRVVKRNQSFGPSGKSTKRRILRISNGNSLMASAVHTMLDSITFIGPFRTPPHRRYAFSGFSSLQAGPTGDEAINLLITEAIMNDSTKQHLRAEVSEWMKNLGLARRVDIRDVARRMNLFSLSVGQVGANSASNISDVGFGLSQVLPVLVQGLLTPKGGTFIVQQPELHLHPDAQAGLADFFLYLSSCGVSCIVETHSEYFLIRLRRRLAEGHIPYHDGMQATSPSSHSNITKTKVSKNKVSILLTSPSSQYSASVSEIEIDDLYQLKNAPEGFMQQAMEDRLALLRAVSTDE